MRMKPWHWQCVMPKKKRRDLSELQLVELQSFSPLIEADIAEVLTAEGSIAARDHVGGTAPDQVRLQISRWRQRLGV